MAQTDMQKSWFQIIRWKLVVSVIIGAVLWVVSGQLGFPLIFQWMFVAYAALGFIVFVVLDAPPLKAMSGWKAGVAVVVFYLVCSAVYVTAGNLLPQFTSQTEQAGIARKTVKFRHEKEVTESLLARTRELSTKADELLAKLNELRAAGASIEGIEPVDVASLPSVSPSIPIKDLTPEQLVERGKLVYQDHECYNCHKVGGKGGKKRGPQLDNIGNLVTQAQLKDKIFNPTVWKAEGFEKRTKDEMPDKFAEVMSEEELHALATYLLTLKNPSVDTPKPIFPPGYAVK